jgi:hypothetical protein
MAQAAVFALSALRALVEAAGLFLLGQGLLYVLSGPAREQNGIYRLFRLLTTPVIRGMRWLAPRQILDRHLPPLAFCVLFWLWIVLAYARHAVCTANGLAC